MADGVTTVGAEAARRCAAHEAAADALARTGERLAWTRLAVGLAGAALFVALLRGAPLDAWWLAGPVLVFAGLVVRHGDVRAREARARRAARWWARSAARIAGTWTDDGPTGAAFRVADHPYADDLDLFGTRSVFARISTARTRDGEARLAAWLLAPASPDVVASRQAAVADLGGRLDLREALALAGDDLAAGTDAGALRRWSAASPGGTGSVLRAGVAAVAVLAAAAVIAAGFGVERPLLPALALEGAVALALRGRVRRAIHGLDVAALDLELLGDLLALLEAERFTAPHLARLTAELRVAGEAPSAAVHRLRRHVGLLAQRANQLFAPIGWVLLWTTQLGLAVDAWRATCGVAVARWLDVVAEVEALASLGAAAWEHPDWCVPAVEAGPPALHAEGLVHPLLPPDAAVANDVALGDGGPALLLVSGSNMSGKSTLLRAMGLAAVLAQAGGVVPARRLRCTPLAVGAAIRVGDSLQEGVSRFYAELRRVKQIVDLADGGTPPALFLLDELFAGTNSHDRRLGADAVVRALLARGAVGGVSTHDLALARLAEERPGVGRNVHFEDRLDDGRLVFDYRLREGVVTRSNALDLMRAVGLRVDG